MKKQVLGILLLCLLPAQLLQAQTPDSWTQQASLPGTARSAGFAFVINGKAYAGGGLNFSMSPIALSDFYEYDPVLDSWTPKAPFGGGGRSGAVAFAVNGKGYVLTGMDTNSVKQNDLWEYDPGANSWTQRTSLPAAGRNYAVAFAIGSKGYLATGYDASGNNFDDCWEYDPANNSWLQRANVPGGTRSSAVGFSIGSKGYLGTGYSSNALNDFYEFDPAANSWTPKANAGGNVRSDATAFAISGFGYICTGSGSLGLSNELLRYDPAANNWTPVAQLPGSGKSNPVGFSVGGHGYVGFGFDNNFSPTADLYKYWPDTSITTSVQQQQAAVLAVYPNPVSTAFKVKGAHAGAVITLYNALGAEVLHAKLNSADEAVDCRSLVPGVYFYRLEDPSGSLANGRLTRQ